MNYLDRSNLTAAYVSGMKTDLHFQGNQFNVINTLFTVGYTMLVGLDIQQDTTY
jgi:ACS family pantothenate transporter-like MFS transporter